MARKKLAIILGIRPDVIRASLVLNSIRKRTDLDVVFIWSGQHYSDNLKDVFFRELGVAPPEIELNAGGTTDAETVAAVVSKLYPVLADMQPEAAVFLGDTNTVMGCLAAAQNNIPVVHIEGCMRAYDWRMPEEKYRTTIDHLSDVIYTYFPEYKKQGVAEGLNPNSIVLVQNLIVDVLNHYYFARKAKYDEMASPAFFRERGIERDEFYLVTCHRRENVHDPDQPGEHRQAVRGDRSQDILHRQLPHPEAARGLWPRAAGQRHHGGPDRLRRDAASDGDRAWRDHRLRHRGRGDRRAAGSLRPDAPRHRAAAGL